MDLAPAGVADSAVPAARDQTGVAICGASLYITLYNGGVVVTGVP